MAMWVEGGMWNVDMVLKEWESGYAAFNNNPIFASDLNKLDANGADDP